MQGLGLAQPQVHIFNIATTHKRRVRLGLAQLHFDMHIKDAIHEGKVRLGLT